MSKTQSMTLQFPDGEILEIPPPSGSEWEIIETKDYSNEYLIIYGAPPFHFVNHMEGKLIAKEYSNKIEKLDTRILKLVQYEKMDESAPVEEAPTNMTIEEKILSKSQEYYGTVGNVFPKSTFKLEWDKIKDLEEEKPQHFKTEYFNWG